MTIVYRQPNNRQGETIVSSVLTDLPSRKERGRQEINKEQPDKILETLNCFDSSFVKPKGCGEITANGKTARGPVNNFSLQVRGTAVTCSIIVEVQKNETNT